uniref:hypothetical protein n=1 Tax=Serratia quinivorans TaxID=137545 RepID=UPI0035C6B220
AITVQKRNISSLFSSTALLANCYRAGYVKLPGHCANLSASLQERRGKLGIFHCDVAGLEESDPL